MIPVARFIPQVHPCPPIQTYHPEQLCHVFCSSEQRPANSIALGKWFQICTRLAPGHKFGIYPLRTITCYQREHIQALQANAVFSQTSLLSNAQQNRMHSVASNFLGDSSPAPRFGAGTGAPAPRFGAGTGVVFPILPSGLPRSFLHALLPPRPDPRPSSSRTLAYASPWNTATTRSALALPRHTCRCLPTPDPWDRNARFNPAGIRTACYDAGPHAAARRDTLLDDFQRPTLGPGPPVSSPTGFGPPATTPASPQPLAATLA